MTTSHNRGRDGTKRRRYNRCPTCKELWGADWMARDGVEHCPSCDGPVYAYIGRSPYDDVDVRRGGRSIAPSNIAGSSPASQLVHPRPYSPAPPRLADRAPAHDEVCA